MTRATSSPTRTSLDSATPRQVICWKMVPRFAPIIGGTEHDKDLLLDLGDGDGFVNYQTDVPVERTAIDSNVDIQVDNLDIRGIFTSLLDADDIDGGVYDFARVTIFTARWDTKEIGVFLWSGWIGEVTRRAKEDYVAEGRSLTQALAQDLTKTYQAACPVDVGGAECGVVGVKTDAPVWTATTAVTQREDGDAKTGDTVRPTTFNGFYYEAQSDFTTGGSEPSWNTVLGGSTSDGGGTWKTVRALRVPTKIVSVISQRRIILDTNDITVLDDTFIKRGLLVFQTGQNALTKPHGIKAYDPYSGEAKLFRVLPFPINAEDNSTDPDQVLIQTGCRHTMNFCSGLYNNWENYRGHGIYIPGNRKLFETPWAKSG